MDLQKIKVESHTIALCKSVNYLIEYFDNLLVEQLECGDISEEDIPQSILLSNKVYEALKISTMDPFGVLLYFDINDKYQIKRFEDKIINHFKKLSPINFFKLINDLGVQRIYDSSREIADKFFLNSNGLKRINKFYNEFSDMYIKNCDDKYTLIYLYVITTTNYLNNYSFLKDTLDLARSKDMEKRKIAGFVINLYLNELIVCKSYRYEDSIRDSLNGTRKFKMAYINTNINVLISSDINIYDFDSISSIYEYIKEYLS